MSNDNPLNSLAEITQEAQDSAAEMVSNVAEATTEAAAETGTSMLDSVMDVVNNVKESVVSTFEQLIGSKSDTAEETAAKPTEEDNS